MAKESLTHIEAPNRIVSRHTFNSEFDVRRNGGIPTGVTFSNGKAIFSAAIEKIVYRDVFLNPDGFAVRLKFTPDNVVNTWYIASKYDTTGIGYIFLQSLTALRFYVGGVGSNYAEISVEAGKHYDVIGVYDGVNTKIYLNGVSGTDAVTPLPPEQYIGSHYVGAKYDDATDFQGEMELIEIYNHALSAEEVSNLDENKRFFELGDHGEQLGEELISDFRSVSNWIVSGEGAGDGIEEVETGLRIVDTAGAGDMQMQYDAVIPANRKYKMVLSVTGSSMFLYPQYPHIPVITSAGTYTYYYTDPSLAYFRIDPEPATDAIITDLSIKEVLVEETSEILNVSAQSGSIVNKLTNDPYSENLFTGIVNGSSFPYTTFDYTDGVLSCSKPSQPEFEGCSTNDIGATNAGDIIRIYFNFTKISGDDVLIQIVDDDSGYSAIESNVETIEEGGSYYNLICSNDNTETRINIRHNNSNIGSFTIDNILVHKITPEIINTATTVFKDGDARVMKFNGDTSKVDCGDIDLHLGERTFISWVKAYSWGEKFGIYDGQIMANGEFNIGIRDSLNRFYVFGNITTVYSDIEAFVMNKWQMLVVTCTVGGIVNFYVDGDHNGTQDQSVGDLLDGLFNLHIGNNNVSSSTWDGLINDVRIKVGILTAKEISQLFSNERNTYGV